LSIELSGTLVQKFLKSLKSQLRRTALKEQTVLAVLAMENLAQDQENIDIFSNYLP